METSRRALRDTSPEKQKTRPKNLNPKKITLIGLPLFVGAIALAGVGVYVANDNIELSETPEASKYIYFEGMEAPEGWSSDDVSNADNRTALVNAQSPATLHNKDRTCSYSRQVFYSSKNEAHKTDEYLTRQYIYQIAEINEVPADKVKPVSLSTDGTELEMLSLEYKTKQTTFDPENGDKISTDSSYHTTAVRFIDTLTPIPDDMSQEDSEGIPAVSVTYQCEDKKYHDSETFNKLLDATQLNLFGEAKPVAPEKSNSDTSSPKNDDDATGDADSKSQSTDESKNNDEEGK